MVQIVPNFYNRNFSRREAAAAPVSITEKSKISVYVPRGGVVK